LKVEVVGSRGAALVDGFAQTIRLCSGVGVAPQYWGSDFELGMVKDFVEALRAARPFPIRGEEGARALEVVSAAARAAALGRPVGRGEL
jgi:predicted dehydrogenase